MQEGQMKIQLKKKPRGRPWRKGQSGNWAGRPRGAKNKTTMAVLEGARRAEEELAKPLMLAKDSHYEAWSDCFVQAGMRFRKDNLERINPKGPIPPRPERLNIREIRQEVVWKGRRCLSQFGWLFNRATHLPLKP
jgi:hypothetical protein